MSLLRAPLMTSGRRRCAVRTGKGWARRHTAAVRTYTELAVGIPRSSLQRSIASSLVSLTCLDYLICGRRIYLFPWYLCLFAILTLYRFQPAIRPTERNRRKPKKIMTKSFNFEMMTVSLLEPSQIFIYFMLFVHWETIISNITKTREHSKSSNLCQGWKKFLLDFIIYFFTLK